MEAADCPGATLRNSTLKDPNIVCCILDTAMIPSIPPNIHVSLQAYLNMVGDTTRTRALYPFYMQALSDAGMTSKREIAAFTSQVSLKENYIIVKTVIFGGDLCPLSLINRNLMNRNLTNQFYAQTSDSDNF